MTIKKSRARSNSSNRNRSRGSNALPRSEGYQYDATHQEQLRTHRALRLSVRKTPSAAREPDPSRRNIRFARLITKKERIRHRAPTEFVEK